MASTLLLAVVGSCVIVSRNLYSTETWCAPGVPRHTPHAITGETCPRAGRMGNVKLAIPQHYLMGPMTYKGIDIWDPKSYDKRPKQPTFDNEIDNFAIKIRLTNFKPIETQQDWNDYDKVGKTLKIQPLENRWIDVEFAGRHYRDKPDAELNFADNVRRWLADEAHRGPFNKLPDVWGLQHYLSAKQPSTGSDGWQYEFFYDATTQGTFMVCENKIRTAPPHDYFSSCDIEFFIPEMKALARAGQIEDKNDLARWKEIEAGVRKVAHSFVVP